MKIVCDNCATKYQIADEKVSGKAFKIRCKKCSHVIVVNKGAGEGGGQAPAGDAGLPQEAPPQAAETAPAGDAVWHLVIEREQVGPMTPDEVRAKVQAGQVDAETYGWREGFDDWLKLSAIEDFRGLFAAGDDQATRRTDAAERATAVAAAGAAAPGADLFGPTRRDESTRTPGSAQAASEGLHAQNTEALSMSAGRGARAQTAEAEDPRPAAGAQGDANAQSMLGARSENSVLFSLNNLSALAGANGGNAPAQKPAGDRQNVANVQSEASGLIDIRAMAAATLGPQSGTGGPISKAPDFLTSDAPPVFTPLAPAMLLPSNDQGGAPKWVWPLVGVGVLMIVGLIGTLLFVFLREPTTGPVATNNPPKDTSSNSGNTGTTIVTTPTKDPSSANAGTSAAPTSKPATPENPAGTSKPSAPSDKGDRTPSKPRDSKKDTKSTKDTKPEKASDPTPAPRNDPPPPPPIKKDKPAKAKDDLDSLLDSASSSSSGKPAKQEKEDLPEQLSMSAIQSTLKSVNVASCKSEGASGVVQVRLTIGKDGKVTSATPSGGAPGGDCVAGKVKSTKFPRFSGDPMTLTFPFIVR